MRQIDRLKSQLFRKGVPERGLRNKAELNEKAPHRQVRLHLLQQGDAQLVFGQDPLIDQDLADIAAYFASQKGSVGAADPKVVSRGEALFRGGDLAKGLPACTGCHSPNGAGNAAAGFPHLGGQHAQYVAKQLTEFRKEEGGRTNDGDTKPMQTISKKLSDEDIAAVSSYIQGLH